MKYKDTSTICMILLLSVKKSLLLSLFAYCVAKRKCDHTERLFCSMQCLICNLLEILEIVLLLTIQ